jgi:hypothetical protein
MRVTLAAIAILLIAAWYVAMVTAVPYYMRGVKDLEITDLSACTMAAVSISDTLSVKAYVAVPIAIGLALIGLAMSRSVSDRASMGMSLAVAVMLVVSGVVFALSPAIAMARLMNQMMQWRA